MFALSVQIMNKCMRCGLSLPQNANNRVGQYHSQCYEMKELVDQITDLKQERTNVLEKVLAKIANKEPVKVSFDGEERDDIDEAEDNSYYLGWHDALHLARKALREVAEGK